MKITVKTGSEWKNALSLLKNYDERLEYVQQQLCENIAEVFLSTLKKKAPSGDEFIEYIQSLRMVKLKGITPAVGYAVVSDRSKVKLQELKGNEQSAHVVYILGTSDLEDPLIAMVASHNPWPVSMVPNGLDPDSVEMVHRPVTVEELDFVKEETDKFLSQNGNMLKQYGANWEGQPDDVETASDNLSSLPDFMWVGLRAEFGINAVTHPHWRPALRDVTGKVSNIIKNNVNIQKALYDGVFRKHLEAEGTTRDIMTSQEFAKEASDFSNKISGS